MKRKEIIDFALTYKGVKWIHRGRSEGGVDCIGYLIKVGEHFNIPVEDIDGYGRQPQGEKFVTHMRKHLIMCEQKLKNGRVAIFRDANFPCHCGIVREIAPNQFSLLHSSIARRKVVEEQWDRTWQGKLRLFLDFPGVEDDTVIPPVPQSTSA